MIQDLIIRKINQFSDERGWLGEIFLPEQDKSINTLLVEENLAVPFMID